MDKDNKTEAQSLPAVAGQVELRVRPGSEAPEPVAWRWPLPKLHGHEWRYSKHKTRDEAEPLFSYSGRLDWAASAPLPKPDRPNIYGGCYSAEAVRMYAAHEVAVERRRWIRKAGAAYTEAHAIFNDSPSETAQEVRDVIEWHLATMRANEEA